MIKRSLTFLGALLAVLLIAGPAGAKNPYSMSDGTWISMMGEVVSVSRDAFELDYGSGQVTVEMDDGDRDADAYYLLEGDAVTVTGVIDDDFFETTKIEASSVYVKKLDTYFFASAADEEELYSRTHRPLDDGTVLLQGKVSKVRGDEFELDTGVRRLTVDVSEMAYDPLDDIGYQRVEPGDMVAVTGTFHADLFEGRNVMAETVTTIVDSGEKGSS